MFTLWDSVRHECFQGAVTLVLVFWGVGIVHIPYFMRSDRCDLSMHASDDV